MSSRTPDSLPHQTTLSTRTTAGEPLSNADNWGCELQRPDLKDQPFGLVIVTQATVRRRTHRGKTGKLVYADYVHVRCTQCQREKWVHLGNIRSGQAKGCRECLQPKQFPSWFYDKVQAAMLRCTNPKHTAWPRYGGRGIEFRFPSVMDACLWLIQNLPDSLDRTLELDRVDNDGHYEPGNIRMSTRKQNTAHTSKPPRTPWMHAFRLANPDVRYADDTLLKHHKKLTDAEIAARWAAWTQKDKRESGISSTPDPFIASQFKVS